MNENVKKAMLRSLFWNFILAVAVFIPFLFLPEEEILGWAFIVLIIGAVSLFIQLIVGIVYIIDKVTKETGQGMLLSIGIILLLGLCTCGVILQA